MHGTSQTLFKSSHNLRPFRLYPFCTADLGTLSECALTQVQLWSRAKCSLGSRHDRKVSRQLSLCLCQKDNPCRSRIGFHHELFQSFFYHRPKTKPLNRWQVYDLLSLKSVKPVRGPKPLTISSVQRLYPVTFFVQPLALTSFVQPPALTIF